MDFKTAKDWVQVDGPANDFLGFQLVPRRVGPAEVLPRLDMDALHAMCGTTDSANLAQYQDVIRSYLHSLNIRLNWVLGIESLDKPRNRRDESSLIESLLDLTFYHNTRLVRRAFGMIDRLCNGSSDLLDSALKAEILDSTSSADFLTGLDGQMTIIRRIGIGMIDDGEQVYVWVKFWGLVSLCSLLLLLSINRMGISARFYWKHQSDVALSSRQFHSILDTLTQLCVFEGTIPHKV